jgi:hypothetical protein
MKDLFKSLSCGFTILLLLNACTKNDYTWNIKKQPCIVTFSDSSEDYISAVKISAMSNQTAGVTPRTYYANKVIRVSKNQSYDLTLTFQTTTNINGVYAYFDWNLDGDYADDNESVVLATNASSQQVITTIQVPADAKKGTSRARFIIRAGYNTGNDPCYESGYYGEVEDYPLEIN